MTTLSQDMQCKIAYLRAHSITVLDTTDDTITVACDVSYAEEEIKTINADMASIKEYLGY